MGASHGIGAISAERDGVLSCDVLDAWFLPSPAAVSAFQSSPQLLRLSPEIDGRHLIETIAERRALYPANVILGAGSSELIHRVLPRLAGDGTVLLTDPTYSEYAFVSELNGIPVRRYPLSKTEGFAIDPQELVRRAAGASLVVIVNPNNPTGTRLSAETILQIRRELSTETSLWIDEAYVDYCPPETSVECFVERTNGLFVLKSLSKAYALSGIRAAYLVADHAHREPLRLRTPPWIVGTAAQAATIAALASTEYYSVLWRQTPLLTEELASMLRELGFEVRCGWINAVLVKVPSESCSESAFQTLLEAGVRVRVPHGMGTALNDRWIRVGLVPKEAWPTVGGAFERFIASLTLGPKCT